MNVAFVLAPWAVAFGLFVLATVITEAIPSNQQSGDVILGGPLSATRRRVIMTNTTRRTALAAGAAALFGGVAASASAAAITDPIIAETERLFAWHRRIVEEWRDMPTIEAEEAFKIRIDLAGFDDAVDRLYATRPISTAGVAALIDFIMEYEADIESNGLDPNIAHGILTNIRNACRALGKGDVA